MYQFTKEEHKEQGGLLRKTNEELKSKSVNPSHEMRGKGTLTEVLEK